MYFSTQFIKKVRFISFQEGKRPFCLKLKLERTGFPFFTRLRKKTMPWQNICADLKILFLRYLKKFSSNFFFIQVKKTTNCRTEVRPDCKQVKYQSCRYNKGFCVSSLEMYNNLSPIAFSLQIPYLYTSDFAHRGLLYAY